MKKTLVALAVAAVAATSANAATVYEADGTKIELKGSLRLYLGKVGDERGDLKNDGSRLTLNATHDLGNGFTALGNLQLRFNADKKNFGNPTTKHLYAGFQHNDVGTLTFGRQATNADDILQDAAYFNSAWLSPLTTSSDRSVKFRSAEWNGFSFGLDYLFGDSDKESTTANYKQGYAGAVFYNYALGEHKFNFGAVYAQDKYDRAGNAATVRVSETDRTYITWAAHLGYNYGPFDLGLNYGQYKNKYRYTGVTSPSTVDVDDLTATAEKGNYILVDAGYRVIEPSRVYAQWERLDGKSFVNDDRAYTYRIVGGVDYKFHKNVVTYVEYAYQHFPNSERNAENTYGVGLRIHF